MSLQKNSWDELFTVWPTFSLDMTVAALLWLVNDKGSPNPQGFWRVGAGVGAGIGIFYPSKTPALVEGMEGIGGHEPDQT